MSVYRFSGWKTLMWWILNCPSTLSCQLLGKPQVLCPKEKGTWDTATCSNTTGSVGGVWVHGHQPLVDFVAADGAVLPALRFSGFQSDLRLPQRNRCPPGLLSPSTL